MTYSQVLKDEQPSVRNLLLQYVCGLDPVSFVLKAKEEVPDCELEKLNEICKQIKAGEPISYILGFRDFYKSRFFVNSNVLVPQSDTETLVEKALECADTLCKKELYILDLCTGSGCIGISVALELKQKVKIKLTLSDISPKALEVAKKNADNLLKNTGVEYKVVESNLFENLKEDRFDFILTNPPYIPSKVIEQLDENVKREPLLALDGGSDGLEIIKKIVFNAHNNLAGNGFLLMEIGYDQGKTVKDLFETNGFDKVEILKDLGNRDRVACGICTKN